MVCFRQRLSITKIMGIGEFPLFPASVFIKSNAFLKKLLIAKKIFRPEYWQPTTDPFFDINHEIRLSKVPG